MCIFGFAIQYIGLHLQMKFLLLWFPAERNCDFRLKPEISTPHWKMHPKIDQVKYVYYIEIVSHRCTKSGNPIEIQSTLWHWETTVVMSWGIWGNSYQDLTQSCKVNFLKSEKCYRRQRLPLLDSSCQQVLSHAWHNLKYDDFGMGDLQYRFLRKAPLS